MRDFFFFSHLQDDDKLMEVNAEHGYSSTGVEGLGKLKYTPPSSRNNCCQCEVERWQQRWRDPTSFIPRVGSSRPKTRVYHTSICCRFLRLPPGGETGRDRWEMQGKRDERWNTLRNCNLDEGWEASRSQRWRRLRTAVTHEAEKSQSKPELCNNASFSTCVNMQMSYF